MELRYGLNPGQAAYAVPVVPGEWPVRVLTGEPSFINLLDALNGWQLVKEASQSLSKPAAASFKHVSPAGAAVAGPLDDVMAELYGVDAGRVGALTSAYLRARDADPKSSYGDFVAVSHPVDHELAEVLGGLVCDGIIAPGYEAGTVERLGRKKRGRFLVMEVDGEFVPPSEEAREVFGVRLTQERHQTALVEWDPALPQSAVEDLELGMAVLRYTQSNSVCYVRDGMTIGIGAGQQSRVDCTRLAGAKADVWWLRRHPAIRGLVFKDEVRRQDRINWQVRLCEGYLTAVEIEKLKEQLAESPRGWGKAGLGEPARDAGAVALGVGELTRDPGTVVRGLGGQARELGEVQLGLSREERVGWMGGLGGVGFVSDGALPFRDNVDQAARHGVRYVAEPGGSVRSGEVEAACREYGIGLSRTGVRLFQH